MRKLSLKPPERTASLQAAWDEQASADVGPCGKSTSQAMASGWRVARVMCCEVLRLSCWRFAGGFSHQYWCVCDYLGLPYREEVQWVRAPPFFHLSHVEFSGLRCP